MDCQFDGEKGDRMAPPHVSGVELHLQVKDIKTIEELPKKTILGKRKKRDGEEEDEQGMWNKKINIMGARVLAAVGCASFD